jgi:cytochrome c-type biogenesis protein
MTSQRSTLIIIGAILFFIGALFLVSRLGGGVFLPLVLATALVDSFNPCALSVLLLTIAFLFSLGRIRSDILKVGGIYIFGIFLVYLLIGLGILRVLTLFSVPNFMGKLGAAIITVVGAVSVMNALFPRFPIKLKIPDGAHGRIAALMEKASLPAALALGALVGISQFPCTGGPYLMILGLLHDSRTALAGFGYLVFYNLIFVVPLVVVLLVASNETLLAKAQAWRKGSTHGMHLWGGIAMILLGLLIFLL